MFHKEFYPTPKEVAFSLFSLFEKEDGYNPFCDEKNYILEPSAGKGDLITALSDYRIKKVEKKFSKFINKNNIFSHYNEKPKIYNLDCVEINPQLSNLLRGSGYNVIGSDFLTLEHDKFYDCILMNPPFSNGLKHLLKAWDVVADNGVIACILPTNILKNDSGIHNDKWKVQQLIDKYGFIKHLGSVFEDAERQTSVDVSAFCLHKPDKKINYSFLKQDDTDDYVSFDDSKMNQQIATKNTIKNMVMAYDKCREIFYEIGKMAQEFGYYYKFLNGGGYNLYIDEEKQKEEEQKVENCLSRLILKNPDKKNLESEYNVFIDGLKGKAWKKIFGMTNMNNLTTKKVSEEFTKVCKENKKMAFSEANILNLLESLMLNQEYIIRECILEVFDLMTKYDKKNTTEAEGWKTNDAWKINKRVIIPYVLNEYTGINYERRQELEDIDRAMGFLEGKKYDDIPNKLIKEIENHLKNTKSNQNVKFSDEFETTYFKVRTYLKGTIHITFKDKDLLERFNYEAAKGRNWLPDDYKYNEKMQRKNKNLLRIES